jgi:hypothetical protein
MKALPPVSDDALVHELATLAAPHPFARRVRTIFFHPSLPVDVRHNAKIHRLTLARWAATAHGRPFVVAPASSPAMTERP